MSANVARRIGQLLSIVVAGLLCTIALHSQTADSLSDIVARGGETNRIYYYRYADLSTFSINTNARLWSFSLRDGGASTPDPDPYPTRLDSLAIRVNIVGDPLATYTTGSFAWVGLYADDTVPRLITEGEIWDTVVTFTGLARSGLVALDDSATTFYLYAKFTSPPNIGAQFGFSIGPRDVKSLDTLGKSSGFGMFPTAFSDTSGDLNRIVTIAKAIAPNQKFTKIPAPNQLFSVDVVVVDSFYNIVRNVTDTITVEALTPFSKLSGTSTRIAVNDVFSFNDLSYPYRINYLELVFRAPGLDSLRLPIRISGGGPETPTVTTLLRPAADTTFIIDGLDAKIIFPGGVSQGSFLTERFEHVPPSIPPQSTSLATFAPRYFRLTSDGVLNAPSGYVLGLPTGDLRSISRPGRLRPVYRRDSLSPWESQLSELLGTDSGRVFARFTDFGEIGLGGSFDVALPIELVELAADNDSGGVVVRWRTASEVHNEGFILRRSDRRDGPFSTIATYLDDDRLRGLGTSPIGRDYAWTDLSPELSEGRTYYYVLVEEDRDGSHEEHGPVAIEFYRTSLPVIPAAGTIYPNPFRTTAHIALPTDVVGVVELEVVDLLGSIVMRSNRMAAAGEHTITLDAGRLPVGTYYVVIRAGDHVLRSVALKVP